jgi:hypothetical protein
MHGSNLNQEREKKMLGEMIKKPSPDTELAKLIYAPIAKNYVDMMTEISESPSEFHIFVLTHTISSILGRNFYIRQGTTTIFPNLYSLIVAPSSEYRKTTATNQYQKLLNRVDWKRHWIGAIGSSEGILKALGENGGTGWLYYSEFGEFLASAKKGFMSDMVEILNDYFDCPGHREKRLKTERYEINDICLNILGATQLESLTRHLDESMLLTGFLPRFFVCYSTNLRKPIIWRDPVDEAMDTQVIDDLRKIRDHVEPIERAKRKDIGLFFDTSDPIAESPVELKVEQDAKALFEDVSRRRRQIQATEPNTISTMMGRVETLVFKLCIIIHMANLKLDNSSIDEATMSKAIELTEFHLKSYSKLVEEDLKFTKFGKKCKKAEDLLRKKKRVPKREFMQYLNMKGTEIDQILNYLVETGMADEEEGRRGGKVLILRERENELSQ